MHLIVLSTQGQCSKPSYRFEEYHVTLEWCVGQGSSPVSSDSQNLDVPFHEINISSWIGAPVDAHKNNLPVNQKGYEDLLYQFICDQFLPFFTLTFKIISEQKWTKQN